MDTTSVIGTKNRKGQIYTDTAVMMNEPPRTQSFYTGSEVIEAVRRASIDVMIAYPITPQSEAAALIGELFCRRVYRRRFPLPC
jgi:pyruvate ferredoxin oxidoreductase alpha subunit